MTSDAEQVVIVLGFVGSITALIFAIGKWASKRESASNRIKSLEDWRATLPSELDKIYARKDVMELRLTNIETQTKSTNETVVKVDDKLDGLLVALAKRGDIERRQA